MRTEAWRIQEAGAGALKGGVVSLLYVAHREKAERSPLRAAGVLTLQRCVPGELPCAVRWCRADGQWSLLRRDILAYISLVGRLCSARVRALHALLCHRRRAIASAYCARLDLIQSVGRVAWSGG